MLWGPLNDINNFSQVLSPVKRAVAQRPTNAIEQRHAAGIEQRQEFIEQWSFFSFPNATFSGGKSLV